MAFGDWKADLARAVADHLGEDVTLTFITAGGGFNASTGVDAAPTTDTVTCKAVRSGDRLSALSGVDAPSRAATVVFVVADADLDGNTPDNRTTVTEADGQVREVVFAEREIGKAAWRLTCRDRQTGNPS